ncbi:MAG: hypothetical protein QOC81_541 [Thermoanaerobaculia bacterium]|jgi:hypothetical protein|nr:hypothetical protein [Thermoanaerobaculia bacterium]
MNAKLKKLKAQIERAGGRVMISEDMPPEVLDMFAKMIADCPDCAASMAASSKQNRSRHEH